MKVIEFYVFASIQLCNNLWEYRHRKSRRNDVFALYNTAKLLHRINASNDFLPNILSLSLVPKVEAFNALYLDLFSLFREQLSRNKYFFKS